MPKAYSYIRMSTDQQLNGDSLRRQQEQSQKYAAEHGLELVDGQELHDIGVSAFRGANIEHGALGAFIAAAEAGKIPKASVLLLESIDRFSRQPVYDAFQLFLRLSKAGIDIVTLSDRQVYKAGEASMMQLVNSIMGMSRAHEESLIKSQRISAAWEKKRRDSAELKLTSIAPAWLRLSADRRTFEPIPQRVALVQRIFDESASGLPPLGGPVQI